MIIRKNKRQSMGIKLAYFTKWMPVFWMHLLLLIALFSAQPELAHAHAEYKRSEPPADAVIPQLPSEVHVWFTQELFRREGANTLAVFGPDETQVDKGDARIDDDDRTHMMVSLPQGLPAGVYTVRWQTLSAEDGDTDSGEFTFTVDPTAPQTLPQSSPTATGPTAAPTPAAAPGSSPTPSPQPGNGLPCLSGVLFGGLALGLVVDPRWRKRGAA